MKPNTLDKKYIYLREKQRCYYCQKTLKLGQVTLDHFQPRSKGGSYDYFNLVSSCMRCNRFKRSSVPDGVDSLHLALFHQAIADGKIICAVARVNRHQFLAMAQTVHTVTCSEGESIARGDWYVLHIKDNKVIRIEG